MPRQHHNNLRNPAHQCIGKVRHRSRAAAVWAAKRCSGLNLIAYHCGHCGGWHTGNGHGSLLKRMYQG